MEERKSFYTKLHDVLSWKRIAAFNLLLLLVFVVPMSVRLAQQSTENRSSAAVEAEPSPEPPVNYPAQSPSIDRVVLFYGKPGDTVVVMGDNFGDYQWGSEVYVGNVRAGSDDVIKWSNKIIEVEIPSQAKTGGVWVRVKNKRANWNGSLFLYDVGRSTKVGLEKVGSGGYFWAEKASEIRRGKIELGWNTGSLKVSAREGVKIENKKTSADSYGNKMLVEFVVEGRLPRAKTRMVRVEGLGKIELVRVEMRDARGELISVYAEPLGSEILF